MLQVCNSFEEKQFQQEDAVGSLTDGSGSRAQCITDVSLYGVDTLIFMMRLDAIVETLRWIWSEREVL